LNRNTIMTSKFKWQVLLVWLALMIGFVWFIAKFDLDMSYVWEKLPYLTGLHLSPDGFIQGVPLTIYVCVLAMLASVLLGLLAALGRLSLNPLAYGISTFYTSFFRGTP
jgi:polar amino acid transport system permease protein